MRIKKSDLVLITKGKIGESKVRFNKPSNQKEGLLSKGWEWLSAI